MGTIASGTSATAPLQGQSHRSGPNFTLLSNDNSTITISSPTGVVFDIKQDVFGTDPTPVSSATNGTTFPGERLSLGNNYYIANPKNASASFAVILNQN